MILSNELSCEFAKDRWPKDRERERNRKKPNDKLSCADSIASHIGIDCECATREIKRIGDWKQLKYGTNKASDSSGSFFKEYKCDLNKQANIIRDYGRWIIYVSVSIRCDRMPNTHFFRSHRCDFVLQIYYFDWAADLLCSLVWHCAPYAQTMTTEMPLFMLRDRGNNQNN